MNRWVQSKRYRYPKCRATYLHDRAYHHQLFQCPKRTRAPQPVTKGDKPK